jgi:hypothetical protein
MYKNGLSFAFSFLILFLPLLLSSKVYATKIYHCKTADGRLEIQDFPCKDITLKIQDVNIPTSSQKKNSKTVKPGDAIIDGVNVSKSTSSHVGINVGTNVDINAGINTNANVDDFYSMPIHPTALKKEITDTQSLGVITLSYISPLTSNAMVQYYQSKIPTEHNKINIRDTVMFTYEEDGINKLVSILDEQGISDVTLQVER